MKSPKEITEALRGKNLSQIARDLDMAYTTIHAISAGSKADYRVSTIQRLSDYLEALEAEQE